MTNEKLYPEVPEDLIDHPYIVESRNKHINDETNALKKNIKKYIKLKHRWNDVYTIFKCTSIGLIVVGSVLGVTFTTCGLATPLIITIITASTAGETIGNSRNNISSLCLE